MTSFCHGTHLPLFAHKNEKLICVGFCGNVLLPNWKKGIIKQELLLTDLYHLDNETTGAGRMACAG